MPRFRAVLFDFFGTLTGPVQRGAGHLSIAELLGCPPDIFLKVLDSSFYDRASGRFGSVEASLRWVCAQVGVHPPATALRAAAAARHQAIRAETRLRDEAVPTLRALRRRGVRTGVISDCTHELPLLLPELAVARLLDVQVFSVQVGRCKPDTALYLDACARLGLSPQDCLYVGDGGSQELTGAQRTGMSAARLAAPDLVDHLVFNLDVEWVGRTLASLSEVVDLVDGVPSPVGALR
ncbi:HAD family hydrolase [Micromonospora sp. DT48]|uniref:HAD family hydrolase n=1 Tax=unclassified Micromonospora TaxID=2617518 RepID=UPI0012BB608E|nr:HAD family hydrolase [Micromonospora sp. CP22]MTK01556.1 HAD family hydrolase [Micromonospora sp. CP22]